VIKPGESSKSFRGLSGIFSELIRKQYSRDTLLIAIGGGVTGDLAGFAASSYMRGIQLAHIPTTILASVDSAIGGKTGINFNKYKNIIGAFYQPEFVLVDTDFLKSLPEEEVKSGVGELIKYAFLTNEGFYNYISSNLEKIFSFDKKVLNNIIYESVLFKGSVVSKDEHESGLRKILNLGHTFAHAYESKANLKLKHGEAVIAGIISALFLSFKSGLLSEEKLKKFLKLPLKVKLPSDFKIRDFKSIISFMYGDKKNKGGEINFILLSDIGKIITEAKIESDNIYYALRMAGNLIEKKL
jgi:3-dehydroquinate synthase